jgi:BASS family bile acid:Na+ symporter
MNIVTDVVLPLALAFIMFVLGLGLTGADFLRVIKQPRDFFVGAFSQVILLPIIAFILVTITIKIWAISPELAIGVMIIAAAPGGVTSNILTAFARGDVALSVSFTAVISLISVVTVPIIVINSAEYFGDSVQNISVIAKAILMFMLVTVPLIIGMLLKRFVPSFVLKFEPIAKKISIVLFALVLLGAIAAERERVIEYFAQAGLITFVLNLVMMIVAYFIAHLLATGSAQKKCITIECGLQNGTLAIFVANEFFGGGKYVIPAATYSLIMFATSLIFIYLVRKIV